MLCNIDIKNVAVIETLSFAPGDAMSVLTGETGAGKSIIIDCVNMILGARTNKSLIRYGEKKANVSALFTVSEELRKKLYDAGIEVEDDVIIQREISEDGKSIARINGTMVSVSFLKEIANLLIDIHGQHDNQALLNPSQHINFLDSYAGLNDLKNSYNELYNKLRQINNDIDLLNKNEQERLSKIDLLKYQTEELKSADLKDGEEEKLKEESLLISSSEKLSKNLMIAYEGLFNGENNAYDYINKALSALCEVRDLDTSLAEIYERLSDCMYNIEDSARELYGYAQNTEFNEERLDEISERLDLIKKLERKYGNTIKECIEFYNNASEELDSLLNKDEKTLKLQEEKDKILKEISKIAEELHNERLKFSKELSLKIEQELHELDMDKAKFEVRVTKSEDFRVNGIDIVEFMITANPGQPLGELSKIASGGELSRVMLAMKTVLSKDEGAKTLIFDEIDTGVSGSAAKKIASKLSLLGKFKQVICVSHLPQIASIADDNFKIEKTSDSDKTTTKIKLLNYDERLLELARMIDGDNVSEASILHAKEMLKRSF